MTMISVPIPEETYQRLQERAREEKLEVPEVVVELLKASLRSTKPANAAEKDSPEERLKAFLEYQKMVQSRPKIDVDLDVSRESIYEGRGE